MNAKTTVGTAALLVFVLLGLGATGSGSASLLSIKYPDKNADVPTGSLIAVSGTSAPSNATHTNCNVAVQINQHGYTQASPHGPKGAADYTKWTAITSTRTQQGQCHRRTGIRIACNQSITINIISTIDTYRTNAKKGTYRTRTTLDYTANPVAASAEIEM